jgi:tRNA U34 5-methylaminomethyl-2-thiouridine-forming methyltransferase MnmC
MSDDFDIITLRCGARAVRHVGHGEVMHPAGGPWEEANRLYVTQANLEERLKTARSAPLKILDVGLGAAANAVAALECAKTAHAAIEIHSFEIDLLPLRLALAEPEGFPFLIPWRAATTSLMEHGEWEGDGARWVLHRGDFLDVLDGSTNDADLVFFDMFSPQHNRLLWLPSTFARIRARCRTEGEGALLYTYSCSTPARVALLLGGFFVGAGASTGTKMETTVAATVKSSLDAPLGDRWLGRYGRSTVRRPEDEAAIYAHPQFKK